jgi:hypothetical protein
VGPSTTPAGQDLPASTVSSPAMLSMPDCNGTSRVVQHSKRSASDLVEQLPGAAQTQDRRGTDVVGICRPPRPHRPGRVVLAERHYEWTERHGNVGLDILAKSRIPAIESTEPEEVASPPLPHRAQTQDHGSRRYTAGGDPAAPSPCSWGTPPRAFGESTMRSTCYSATVASTPSTLSFHPGRIADPRCQECGEVRRRVRPTSRRGAREIRTPRAKPPRALWSVSQRRVISLGSARARGSIALTRYRDRI